MSAAEAQSNLTILEIGPVPFIARTLPGVEFYSTWHEADFDPAPDRHLVTLGNLPRIARALADPRFDLVVVHTAALAPWTLQAIGRTIFRRRTLRHGFSLARGYAPQLARGQVAAPLAALDLDDPPFIDRSNVYLLDRARCYFKRELPVDHWQVFARTLHNRLPTPRFRALARNRERIAKLRPLSLGVPPHVLDHPAAAPVPPAEKTADVFFAGRVHGSATVREQGLQELLALKADGYVVDIPERPLATDEYLARCARAWIVWAPAGFGWQSFRGFEAAVCGSVPLSNRPTIERHAPFVEGEHALYYDAERGALGRAVKTALADRDRLTAIASAARAHVLAHHTPAAIARYVIETTLQQRAAAV